jgi:hypothetical protein
MQRLAHREQAWTTKNLNLKSLPIASFSGNAPCSRGTSVGAPTTPAARKPRTNARWVGWIRQSVSPIGAEAIGP